MGYLGGKGIFRGSLYYSLEVMIEPGESNPKPPIESVEQKSESLSDLPNTLINTAKSFLMMCDQGLLIPIHLQHS